MDTMLLRTFQHHVTAQCKFLIAAATDANEALTKRDIDRIFYALQNMLNAGANISKAFWGSGGKFSAERKPLRDSIKIDDNSPLREVAMRNNFEHFDERLDRWWKESKRHSLVDFNLGLLVHGIEDIDIFRNFDPKSKEVIFVHSSIFSLKKAFGRRQRSKTGRRSRISKKSSPRRDLRSSNSTGTRNITSTDSTSRNRTGEKTSDREFTGTLSLR